MPTWRTSSAIGISRSTQNPNLPQLRHDPRVSFAAIGSSLMAKTITLGGPV
jgi:hypothetical protein